MANIFIDLTNYRSNFSDRVPEGDYLLQVQDITEGKTNNGDPKLTVYNKIVGGDQDGLSIVDTLTLTEKAMFRLVGFLQAVNIPTPQGKFNLRTETVVGKTFVATIQDGAPYGERQTVRSQIAEYSRATTSAAQVTPTEDPLAALDVPAAPVAAPAAPVQAPAAEAPAAAPVAPSAPVAADPAPAAPAAPATDAGLEAPIDLNSLGSL